MVSVQENVSLKRHTVFKIGGPARFFVEVKSVPELKEAFDFVKEKSVPFFIAGAGSNILVSDKGFDGLWVKNGASKISVSGQKMFCESGTMLSQASAKAAEAGLSGLEWGLGIPGTVGGSVRGNAGCFGGEIEDVLDSVEVFDSNQATSYTLQAENCEFGYRHSIFKKMPQLVILSATFRLKTEDRNRVLERMRQIAEQRVASQDIGVKCAGCIFKNVPWTRKDINKAKLAARFPVLEKFRAESGISAGFLIDEVGLKGKELGGAIISRRHANFVVNSKEASAEDVVMLIALAKEYVHRKFGIILEEEIQYVGFE